MRTFISIEIPRKIKKEIVKIQNQLPEFFGKKTEPENLHLTLKFLGEVDEKKIEEIKKRLEKIKVRKFEVEINSLGFFSEKFIRIIWLHLTNCEELQKKIDNSLESLFEKEKRFMSHLTIARVKNVKNKKEFLEKLKKIKIPAIKFEVNNFCLMKSELKEKSPEYFVIEKYSLS